MQSLYNFNDELKKYEGKVLIVMGSVIRKWTHYNELNQLIDEECQDLDKENRKIRRALERKKNKKMSEST